MGCSGRAEIPSWIQYRGTIPWWYCTLISPAGASILPSLDLSCSEHISVYISLCGINQHRVTRGGAHVLAYVLVCPKAGITACRSAPITSAVIAASELGRRALTQLNESGGSTLFRGGENAGPGSAQWEDFGPRRAAVHRVRIGLPQSTRFTIAEVLNSATCLRGMAPSMRSTRCLRRFSVHLPFVPTRCA